MGNKMMVMNYNTPKEIECDMRRIIKQCTGRTYVFSCRASHLKGEERFYLVMGKGTYGYSVLTYDCIKKSMFWGHYDLPFPVAMDYIANKLNGRE
jgi:hypothetical protein